MENCSQFSSLWYSSSFSSLCISNSHLKSCNLFTSTYSLRQTNMNLHFIFFKLYFFTYSMYYKLQIRAWLQKIQLKIYLCTGLTLLFSYASLSLISVIVVTERSIFDFWHLFSDATCYVRLSGDSENLLKLSASPKGNFSLSPRKCQTSCKISTSFVTSQYGQWRHYLYCLWTLY